MPHLQKGDLWHPLPPVETRRKGWHWCRRSHAHHQCGKRERLEAKRKSCWKRHHVILFRKAHQPLQKQKIVQHRPPQNQKQKYSFQTVKLIVRNLMKSLLIKTTLPAPTPLPNVTSSSQHFTNNVLDAGQKKDKNQLQDACHIKTVLGRPSWDRHRNPLSKWGQVPWSTLRWETITEWRKTNNVVITWC